jgi:formylglycine-generating enzyme required for sulfatase activity
LNYWDINCEFAWADRGIDDGYAEVAPVGSYSEGSCWCGALDTAGEIAEFVGDFVGESGPGGLTWEMRFLRGGSWIDSSEQVVIGYVRRDTPATQMNTAGFR